MKVKGQREEAKQQRLDEKRLFEERREQALRDKKNKREFWDNIFWWFVGLISLLLLSGVLY